MLWQVTAREIEDHENSKVQSEGSFAGELKVFFFFRSIIPAVYAEGN